MYKLTKKMSGIFSPLIYVEECFSVTYFPKGKKLMGDKN